MFLLLWSVLKENKNENRIYCFLFVVCVEELGTVTVGATETWECLRPITGRYVELGFNTLKTTGHQALNLCEVEVYQG